MADCRLPAPQRSFSSDFSDEASTEPGISLHACVKARDVAAPATELFYSGTEGRTYGFLYSDDDEDWKDEIFVRVSDFADAETQPGQQLAFNKLVENTKSNHIKHLASEPRLGPVRHSDMGLTSATSTPTFSEDPTETTEGDTVVRFATDAKKDDGPGSGRTRDFTKQRAVRSEGLVKAGERPQGRGRILEFGRSIANVLIRPFRRQGRRREVQPTRHKVQPPDKSTATPKPETTSKLEESRLPVDKIIAKQFHSKETTAPTTIGRPAPTVETAQ